MVVAVDDAVGDPVAPSVAMSRVPMSRPAPGVASSSETKKLTRTAVAGAVPWFTIVLGLIVVALGVSLLSGRQLTLSLPKLERGGGDGTLPSMYLFGVSYAVASLSCAIAPFLVVTSSASNADNFGSRVLTFVMYGVGMGLVITVLTVALAMARGELVARFRELVPTFNRIAGGLMVLAGAYVAYYGYYELRLLNWGEQHTVLGLVRAAPGDALPVQLVARWDAASRSGELYLGSDRMDLGRLLDDLTVGDRRLAVAG